jgi:hypothetical protein
LLAAAVACGSEQDTPRDLDPNDPQIGGQTGEEAPGCSAVALRALSWSERTPLGFSADELSSALGAEREARLDWADGRSTRVLLALQRREGDLLFADLEPSEPQPGRQRAIALQCNDVLSVPVTLSLVTDDGAFAEQLPLLLLAENTARVTTLHAVEADKLTGTFRSSQLAPAPYERLLLQFALTFGASTWSGIITGQAVSDRDGAAPTGVFEIGSF